MENDRSAPATKGDILNVLEAVRDAETKLLTAFYGYAKSRGRLATLETRVTDIERRLNEPPAR